MSVPTHVASCQTQMWKTSCQDCKEAVFFFSCSCGSRVLFDSPGDPWPKHECIEYQIRYFREQERLSSVEVRQRIEKYSRITGISIPPNVEALLVKPIKTGPIRTVRILADKNDCVVAGKIILVDKVNFEKRYQIKGVFGRGILGDLVDENYYRIVLRQPVNEENRDAIEFEFFYPQHQFDQWSGVKLNSFATVELASRSIPGIDLIWIAKDLYPN